MQIINILRKKSQNNPIHKNLLKIKYLGTNLSKEIKDLYNENYKILKKETE
jgi:hypothetical protein